MFFSWHITFSLLTVQCWSIFKCDVPWNPFSQTSRSILILDFITWEGDVARPKRKRWDNVESHPVRRVLSPAEPGSTKCCPAASSSSHDALVHMTRVRGVHEPTRLHLCEGVLISWTAVQNHYWRLSSVWLSHCDTGCLMGFFFKANERLINDLCRLKRQWFRSHSAQFVLRRERVMVQTDWGNNKKVSLRKGERCWENFCTGVQWPRTLTPAKCMFRSPAEARGRAFRRPANCGGELLI